MMKHLVIALSLLALILAPSIATAATASTPLPEPASAAGLARAASAVSPETTVGVPAPGHTSTWSMAVSTGGSSSGSIALTTLASDGMLVNGEDAPRVTIVNAEDGRTVIDRLTLGQLQNTTVPVAEFNNPGSLNLIGTIAMPREAGNEYQGESQQVTFRFAVTDNGASRPDSGASGPANGASPSWLANTGSSLTMPLIFAVCLLLAGLLAFLVRRRKQTEETR